MRKTTALAVGISAFVVLQALLISIKVPAWADLLAVGVFANNLAWFAIVKQIQKGHLQALASLTGIANKSSDNMALVAGAGLQMAGLTLQVTGKDLQRYVQTGYVTFDQQGLAELPDGTKGQIEII